MSAFLPIVKDDKGLFVDIRKELTDQVIFYKKVKYDGTPNKFNDPPKEYYDANGNKIEPPSKGDEVFMKLGKSNQHVDTANVIDGKTPFEPNTYYMHIKQSEILGGGRKPKRPTHLSKKRAMKSRRRS